MGKAKDRKGQELINLLRNNDYLPIVVDGDLVQLVRPSAWHNIENEAVLCIVEITVDRPYYLNYWNTTVPFYKLPEVAIESLDVVRNTDGSVA